MNNFVYPNEFNDLKIDSKERGDEFNDLSYVKKRNIRLPIITIAAILTMIGIVYAGYSTDQLFNVSVNTYDNQIEISISDERVLDIRLIKDDLIIEKLISSGPNHYIYFDNLEAMQSYQLAFLYQDKLIKRIDVKTGGNDE